MGRWNNERGRRSFLFFLSLAGLVLVVLTTARYGAGVSADAARNLATADNLWRGNGFVDMVGAAFVLWPPLYPLLLAGLRLLTGADVFNLAWIINVLLFPLNLWLGGLLLFRIFRDRPLYAMLASLAVLLSRSTLRVYANVASEPLFMTFMFVFFLAAAEHLSGGSRRSLWTMALMAGLAAYHRYLGVLFFPVGMLVVFIRAGWRGSGRAMLPFSLAAIPLLSWGFLHNLPLSGGFFGPRDFGAMFPLENMSLSLTKMLWWFMPFHPLLQPLMLRPWIPLTALLILLLAINRMGNWRDWIRTLTGVWVWPSLLFALAYYFALAFTVITNDHRDLTSDRYYVVILPAVVTLLLMVFDRLILPHLDLNRAVVRYGLAAAALVWFLYPLLSLGQYVGRALTWGEPSHYNVSNSARYHDIELLKAGRRLLEQDPGAQVYSNYVNTVWFYYRRPMPVMPMVYYDITKQERLDLLKETYPGWPGAAHGYIIWFLPNQYDYIVPPGMLATVADLKLVYEDDKGQIYFVQAKK